MATPELLQAIKVECDRQHVGPDRHPMLLASWARARDAALAGEALTVALLQELGGLAEPDNGGQLRTTPVTFANGGSAAPGPEVSTFVARLLEHWPGSGDEYVARSWLREFLWIHPFTDGNGRTGWVLQQWLLNSWDAPQPLIDFGW